MTKKEFKQTLAEMENVLVAVGNTRTQLVLGKEFIRDAEGTLDGMYKVEWRKCTEVHSTYLLFSNGLRLDFDQIGKHNYYEVVPEGTENYFKVKKYLVQEHVHDNGFSYVIYAVR